MIEELGNNARDSLVMFVVPFVDLHLELEAGWSSAVEPLPVRPLSGGFPFDDDKFGVRPDLVPKRRQGLLLIHVEAPGGTHLSSIVLNPGGLLKEVMVRVLKP